MATATEEQVRKYDISIPNPHPRSAHAPTSSMISSVRLVRRVRCSPVKYSLMLRFCTRCENCSLITFFERASDAFSATTS
jgi:hypothetical protein